MRVGLELRGNRRHRKVVALEALDLVEAVDDQEDLADALLELAGGGALHVEDAEAVAPGQQALGLGIVAGMGAGIPRHRVAQHRVGPRQRVVVGGDEAARLCLVGDLYQGEDVALGVAVVVAVADLDGGFGREQSPLDLDTIADLQKVPDLLAKRGYKLDDIMAGKYGPPGGALMLFRSYPRLPFYEQVHDNYPFHTDTGRMHSYSDDPTAIDCGENFIVHREGPEATPYLPNVIVSSNPLVRPNDYGIPLDAEHWDERTVRNVKLPWHQVKTSSTGASQRGSCRVPANFVNHGRIPLATRSAAQRRISSPLRKPAGELTSSVSPTRTT